MVIPVVVITGVTLGLGSYNKRSMEEWITSYTKASANPLRRVWKRDGKTVKVDQFFSTKPEFLPGYLSAYLLTKDEYLKVMRTQNLGTTTNFTTIIDTPEVTPTITITPSTAYEYADVSINVPQVPNTLILRIQEDDIPMEGVIANVKTQQGDIVISLRSNKDGILYFNQPFAPDEYDIDFQLPDTSVLPKVHILFDGSTYPLINLTPLS
jgi:hypothetical protein